ncbi:30S ribosomal protein S9 [Candidatus Micrarchaeota archaeon]|nr:30S ribosomal protein S9 [Candidatus Micrarchaeota archaeon]MBU1930924.1 30S ribosomal protein S9 [Candidatus Micrarchaeota archaeon]
MEIKSKRKRKARGITSKAKKKSAIARAVIKKGKGIVRVNKKLLNIMGPPQIKAFIEEPILIAGEKAKEVNIYVHVKGSGFMSQAVAARSCIAKALVAFFKDEKLKKKMLAYDRLLLVDDIRRKEAKKQLGRGARGKKQKSKR